MRLQEAFQRLDQCLQERMQAFHSPALTYALTDQERLIRLSSFGYADLELKRPVQADHLFAIGSIGKSFTAIAVLQAAEKNLLNLRAPVKEYLPWFEVQSAYPPITIHHLLTHTAGLPRGTDFSPDARGEVYALRNHEAGFAPGEHFYYSDTGYKVLGLVLEAVMGKSYHDIIYDGILVPLEMHHTSAVTRTSLRPQMATGYRDLYDDRPHHISRPLVPASWIETDSGDGCIVSTAEDMAKFARMLLNGGAGPHGPLLSEASYRKMITPQIEDDGESYSYGLYVFDDEGYRIAGHGGDVPGYEAYLWLDLDNSLGTVVLMTTPYTPRASFMALEFFREAFLGRRLPAMPPLPDFTHISEPGDYAGVYRSDQCELTIEAENHHLFLVCRDQRVTLEEREHDCFYASHPDWDLFLLRFERNASGVVCEVSHGPRWFTNDHYQGPKKFEVPGEWHGYAGHYRSHNPWATNFRIYHRKGQLILCRPSGDEEVLTGQNPCCFRIGEEGYAPERISFEHIIDGQALRVKYSGCPYYRFFTP